MKKLVLMAVVICTAFAAQASASYQYLFVASDVQGADGNLYSGSVTLYCDTLGINQTFELSNGSYSDSQYININSEYYTVMANAQSAHSEVPYTVVAEMSVNDVTYQLSYNSYELVVDFTGDGDVFRYTPQLNTVKVSDWVASIPEPTSAFLMLLGFAGLVLKRKRV